MPDHTEDNQDFLSQWLSGARSNEEAKQHLGDEDFNKYVQILNEVDQWQPDLDDQVFDPSKILSEKKETKTRFIGTWQAISIAASLFLVVGLSYFFFGQTKNIYTAKSGEILEVDLPDGKSRVVLGHGSSVQWDEGDWSDQGRTLTLSGKAYFDVHPGSPFEVNTENGKVQVLGTQFEVSLFDASMMVRCFEGKVQAIGQNGQNIVLTQGESSLHHNGKWEDKETTGDDEPTWMEGEVKFKNAPLAQVINEIKSVYNLNVTLGNVNLQRRFTGAIPTDNLKLTLVIVFDTLEIDYQLDGNELILSE